MHQSISSDSPSRPTHANSGPKPHNPWNRFSALTLLAASILAVLPVWLPAYPAMADLPQHAAQVALLRDLHNPHFTYASLFHLNWFTPYLLGYMLVYALAPLFGIVAACKLVVSLYVVGIPLSTALLLGFADIDVFWAVLSIPAIYGFTYQWGFLNFLIAAPACIVFLWFVLRSSATMRARTAVFFAAAAIGLFFCHALICAFFGLCAVFSLLLETRSLKAAAVRILPLAAVLPVAFLWMHRTLANPVTHRPIVWDLNWHDTVETYYTSLSQELHLPSANWGRITGFFPRLLGMVPSWRCVLIGAALWVLPFCAGMRLSKKPSRWAPFLLCIAVLLWCPHSVFGTDFVYQRFTMFAIPLFLFLLRESPAPPGRTATVRWISLVLVAVLIASASMKALIFSRQTRGFTQALSLMQPGERALSLAFDHDDGVSIAPEFLHFPQWYAAKKSGIVDPSAAMMHPELVVFRPGKVPPAVLWDFEWVPEQFNWDDYSGELYRYFVVRSKTDRGQALFAQAPCLVTLRFHQGEWWLYESASGCAAASEGQQ